jgi:uncharacterized membrane protein required for colicin V production
MNNILTIAICAVLIWSAYIGWTRGLILQLFYTFSSLAAAVVANTYYKEVGEFLSMYVPFSSATKESKLQFFNERLLFQLDHAFYAGLAFIGIFVLAFIALRIIGLFIGGLIKLTPLGGFGAILGAFFAVCVTYFGLQMGFTLLALVPMNSVQTLLHNNDLIQFMVLKTPVLSDFLLTEWVQDIVNLSWK